MKMPSAKRLEEAFPALTATDIRRIRRFGHATDSWQEFAQAINSEGPAATLDYVRGMHSDPYETHMWRVTVALHAMDQILGTYGVEGLGAGNAFDGPAYEYLNTGDTYATTLIYSRKADALTIGAWGDIAERMPASD